MKISRIGIADLPLHRGGVPKWLIDRMIKLGSEITHLIVEEYGRKELLLRLSNPFWFQALGCVLGFDWHSSGLTTVVTAILKTVINREEMGIIVVGGKGKRALKTPKEISIYGERIGISSDKIEFLKKISRLTAKVDNCAIQDGYNIYHHSMLITNEGHWTVIQQGMNLENRYARRYHWFSESIRDPVEEPHSGIISERIEPLVLDMTSRISRDARKTSVDIVNEGAKHIKRLIYQLRSTVRSESIIKWLNPNGYRPSPRPKVIYLSMPKNINWNAIERAYELSPKNYEELLLVEGIGPSTIRALALISELIYGDEVSWKDPAKYSFAFGGKDGVPYPVNTRCMDEAIQFLRDVVIALRTDEKNKRQALNRLRILQSRLRN